MKKIVSLLFVSLALLTALLTTPSSVRADDGPVILSYQANQKALLSCNFCERLFALPEWEPFSKTFTDACDHALGKELSREKLEKRLPKDIVDVIRAQIDQSISTRKIIEGYFKHVEAIVFELQADFDDDDGLDENLKDLAQFLAGKKKDLDLSFDGVLAFIVDVNPRKGLEILKYFREGTDYKFLKNETDGDFILKFDFEYKNREIEFCCAGLKLNGENRYALLFADDEDIARRCKAFKTGRYADLDTSKPMKKWTLEEPCFLFLDHQCKRTGLNSHGVEFFGKIKRAGMVFQDVDGVSQCELSAEMRSKDDALAGRDLLSGLIALAQLNQDENSGAKNMLRSIKIDNKGNAVAVAVQFDSPELWKLIAQGLIEATKKIEEKK